MIKNTVVVFSLLFQFVLFSQAAESSKGLDKNFNIPVVTDEKELRRIAYMGKQNIKRKDDFVPQEGGIVLDKKTGLQWMRCLLGQTWNGKTCDGKARKFTSEDMQEINNYFFSGYDDWRIPTVWELETLVYCHSGKIRHRVSDTGAWTTKQLQRDAQIRKENPYDVRCVSDHEAGSKTKIVEDIFPNTPRGLINWTSTDYTSEALFSCVFSNCFYSVDFSLGIKGFGGDSDNRIFRDGVQIRLVRGN